MKSLAKIASRFNLKALIFQNFPLGACPQTFLEGMWCVPKSNNIFHCHSFQLAPSNFLPCYAHVTQGVINDFTHKAKLNFCHAYRVNCFKEQAENQSVARLNIRGVLLVVRNRSS